MSKTKIIKPDADSIAIIMQRDIMPATGTYETLNSSPSIMDYPSARALEYRSYWFSISVVFTLKDILGWSIFVSGGNEERKNVSLNVVNFAIFSSFETIESYQSYLRGILTTSPI